MGEKLGLTANELRIDNWVLVDGEPKKIDRTERGVLGFNIYYTSMFGVKDCISHQELLLESSGRLKPIKLTHEILEKCGFSITHPTYDDKRFSSSRYTANDKHSRLIFDYDKRIYFIEINGTIIKNSTLLHSFHQLQNLYFALTGEELNINL